MENVEGEPGDFDMVLDLGEGTPSKKIMFDKPTIAESNAIKEELDSFGTAIENDTTPIVPIEDGRAALEIAHQIVEKIKASGSLVIDNI
jgi:hypothetical protein